MRLSGRFTNGPANSPTEKQGRMIEPSNEDFNAIAQKAVDTLATVTARKTTNALKVDGWPVIVHRYRQGGHVCTCKLADAAGKDGKNPREPVDLYDTDLNITDRETDISPDGRSKPSLSMRFNLRGNESGTIGNRTQQSNNDQSAVNVRKILHSDMPLKDPPVVTTDVDFDRSIENFPLENLDTFTAIALFNSMDDKPCGVCAGTGFVDSYQWVSGQKFTLLPANVIFSNPENGEVNTATRPHSIDLFGEGACTWALKIPAYFEQLDVWRVRDNIERASDITLSVDITGTGVGPWLPLSHTVFDPLKTTGGKVIVKATPRNASSDDITMFTHIDLFLRTNELPYCQFPQLDRDINGSTLEALLNVNFEIDPAVGLLTRQSVIEAVGMSRLWFITSITEKRTAKGYIFNITGNVQVVQSNFGLMALSFYHRWSGKNPNTYQGIALQSTAGFPNRDVKPFDEDK